MLPRLFWLFLRLGLMSFGGGYPMLALILQMGADEVGLTAAEFADMTALELLASGPVTLNSATYIGYIKAGLPGALAATAGVLLPAIVLAALLYFFVSKFRGNRYVAAFLSAIQVAGGGILLTTSFTLAKDILLLSGSLPDILQNPLQQVQWAGVLICVVCAIAIRRFKVNPILTILAGGVLGALLL